MSKNDKENKKHLMKNMKYSNVMKNLWQMVKTRKK